VYTHLRDIGRHLSYGITQCYLPPNTGERAPEGWKAELT